MAVDLLECGLDNAFHDDLRLLRRTESAYATNRGATQLARLPLCKLGIQSALRCVGQGERLDWFNSGVIVALCAAGLFILAAAVVRRCLQPNPMVNLAFLANRNVFLLAAAIFFFKFAHLSVIVLIPVVPRKHSRLQALGNRVSPCLGGCATIHFRLARGRPGDLVRHARGHSGRICAAGGVLLDERSCRCRVGGLQFLALRFAVGLWSFDGLRWDGRRHHSPGTGKRSADKRSQRRHILRLVSHHPDFGGQVGVATLTRFISVREKFHSNRLGLDVSIGSWTTEERLRSLTGGLLPHSSGLDEARLAH